MTTASTSGAAARSGQFSAGAGEQVLEFDAGEVEQLPGGLEQRGVRRLRGLQRQRVRRRRGRRGRVRPNRATAPFPVFAGGCSNSRSSAIRSRNPLGERGSAFDPAAAAFTSLASVSGASAAQRVLADRVLLVPPPVPLLPFFPDG